MLYNELNIPESEVQWPLHFRVSDSWDMRSDKNINSGTILSFDAVCVGSPVLSMLRKK